MKTFKLLTLSASLLACGLGLSGNAHANAYAVATNNVREGFVDTRVDGVSDFSQTYIQVGTPKSESSSSATIDGVGVANQDTTPTPDARTPLTSAKGPGGTGSAAVMGTVRPNELVTGVYYDLYGNTSTKYSWGDAMIVSEQVSETTRIVARNAAETNIPGTGTGNADGTNKSSTVVNIPIVVGGDCGTTKVCTINFSFEADPFIFATLDALAAGVVARGTLAFSITLTKLGDLFPTFAWAPNGKLADGIVGGVETADAENLNLTREVLVPGGPDAMHSGNYCGLVTGAGASKPPVGGAGCVSPFGAYAAHTNALGYGTYTLSISMNEKTDAERIPEPATLALLGLGLAGLGLARRRKQV